MFVFCLLAPPFVTAYFHQGKCRGPGDVGNTLRCPQNPFIQQTSTDMRSIPHTYQCPGCTSHIIKHSCALNIHNFLCACVKHPKVFSCTSGIHQFLGVYIIHPPIFSCTSYTHKIIRHPDFNTSDICQFLEHTRHNQISIHFKHTDPCSFKDASRAIPRTQTPINARVYLMHLSISRAHKETHSFLACMQSK